MQQNDDNNISPSGDDADETRKFVPLELDQTDGAQAVILRENAELREKIKSVKAENVRVWGAVAVIILICGIFMVYMIETYPKSRYIPTTDNKAICEVPTEASPRVTATAVQEFARDAVLDSYSYDYVNYRKAIQDALNTYYTPIGRKAFNRMLDQSGNLDKVIRGRYILKATGTNVPNLEAEGTRPDGTHFYTVTVPIAIEFYAGGEQQPRSRQDYLATVTVVGMNGDATNRKGIGIEGVALAPYTPRR